MNALSETEQARIRRSIEAVASRAGQAIGQAPDAWRAVAFVESLHSSIDKVMATWNSADPRPACSPGCSFCCNAKVEVSDPEALHIARHLLDVPAARRTALASRLAVQAELRSRALPHAQVPCAFLEEGLCAIYAHRPAPCRKAHSLSRDACSTNQPRIPQALAVAVQCEVLIAGTHQGYRSRGLPAGRHELSEAVLAALSSVSGLAEWYDGTPLCPPSSTGAAAGGGDVA